MHDVNDIAFTSARVFLLSTPFSFIGAPYGGGTVDSYSMTATIPSFMALAIGPAKSAAGGGRTNQNLGGTELPASGGRLFGLKGGSSSASDRGGEVVIDGTDLVFWTRSPAQLVQASLAGGEERVLADYPDAMKRTVTAMALDATDIWFASVITNGALLTGGTLHRAPRAGGAVVDVASLPDSTAASGILFDGNTIHMATSNGPLGGSGESMLDYDRVGGAVTYRGLMQQSLGSSPIAFDGTFFYWAESNGSDTCNGTFKRRNKNGSPEETLLTNLDRVVRLRSRSGAFYLGSSAYPFRKPATPGQLIEWKP